MGADVGHKRLRIFLIKDHSYS